MKTQGVVADLTFVLSSHEGRDSGPRFELTSFWTRLWTWTLLERSLGLVLEVADKLPVARQGVG